MPLPVVEASALCTFKTRASRSRSVLSGAYRKDDLRPFYHLSLKDAAVQLGICATTLKRVCRRLGIRKWPRRALARLSQHQVGILLLLCIIFMIIFTYDKTTEGKGHGKAKLSSPICAPDDVEAMPHGAGLQ